MRQFIRFGIIGVTNTILSYMLYVVFTIIFQTIVVFGSKGYLAASILSFVISVLWSFYWNNRFTFKQEEREHRSRWRALVKTYASYSISGFFLHNILLYVFIEQFGISEYLAYLINLSISMPLNFALNKFWAFK